MIRIAVDAACTKDQTVEFRGVNMDKDNEEIFHRGPFPGSSSNVGEVLGVILGLAWLRINGHKEFVLYTDSAVAMTWVKNKFINTALEHTQSNQETWDMIRKGNAFLHTCTLDEIFRVVKWSNKLQENPADFQRKGNGQGPRSQVPGREPKTKKKEN